MKKSEKLYNLAKNLAGKTYGFLDTKGPGIGNHATNQFVASLNSLAIKEFGEDYSERNICGENALAVDYYFPDEEVIVEVALGLKNPNSEYEKDILKTIIAKQLGSRVKKLIFITKPGGAKKCNQPGRVAVKKWLSESNGIEIVVWDL